MPEKAITVEGLGKRYLLGHYAAPDERYATIRDALVRSTRRVARKTRDVLSGRPLIRGHSVEDFWALRDLSFEVERGESLGVIGRNGAGKSTLLKILSRITEPTTGRITIRGSVASLLEVGTGFHPELTGRENIFLNGAVLGMTRAEVRRKFDEIVAFADIENFLDTPVKRYSSGMYVRLAFAVAAHVQPEILVVDEVLAVGDSSFQKKCLGKMSEVASEGRTVLFVSHNMAAVRSLCNKAVYLRNGMMHSIGDTAEVIQTYLRDVSTSIDRGLAEREDRQGSGEARFASVRLADPLGHSTEMVLSGDRARIYIKLAAPQEGAVLKDPAVSIGLDNSLGQRILHMSNRTTGQVFPEFHVARDSFCFDIPRLSLVADTYSLVLFLSVNENAVDWIQNAATFNVEAGDFYGTGKLPPAGQSCFLADYSVATVEDDVRD